MNAKQVIDLFVDQGIIDQSQVDDINQEIATSGKDVVETLVDFGFTTDEGFYQTLAEALGLDVVNLSGFEPPQDVLRLIPAGLARLHGALPIGMSGDAITVCLVDPMNAQVPEDLRFALGRNIHVVVAPVHQIEELLRKNYGTDAGSMDEILSQLGSEEIQFGDEGQIDLQNVEAEANAAPIIRYVDLILYQAIQDRASDIHFEPFETEF